MGTPYGNHLEEAVLAASPAELTNMLFERLLSEIRSARVYLQSGEIALRSASAARAVAIGAELARALDDERGGELSRSLRQLYGYVLDQVNEGNTRQQDRCFANAEEVVLPLAEAWQELSRQSSLSGLSDVALPFWEGEGSVAASLSFSG